MPRTILRNMGSAVKLRNTEKMRMLQDGQWMRMVLRRHTIRQVATNMGLNQTTVRVAIGKLGITMEEIRLSRIEETKAPKTTARAAIRKNLETTKKENKK